MNEEEALMSEMESYMFHSDSYSSESLKGSILDVDPIIRRELGEAYLSQELRKANISDKEAKYLQRYIRVVNLMAVNLNDLYKVYLRFRLHDIAVERAWADVNSGKYIEEVKTLAEQIIDSVADEIARNNPNLTPEEIEDLARRKAEEYAKEHMVNSIVDMKKAEILTEAVTKGYVPRVVLREFYQHIIMTGSRGMSIIKVLFTRFVGTFTRRRKSIFEREGDEYV